MLLDEPLAGLDDTETTRMKDRIRALHGAIGCTTLLIEHKLSVVMEVCSHLTVLDYGQVIDRSNVIRFDESTAHDRLIGVSLFARSVPGDSAMSTATEWRDVAFAHSGPPQKPLNCGF
jgi:energy-coupling factor transporter ATP-binding protein EcfA2